MTPRTILQWVHILLFGPLLIAIGMDTDLLPKIPTVAIGTLGIFILGYHASRAYGKYKQNLSSWVNIFHALIVAPPLLAIGYYGVHTPRWLREVVLMLGFTAMAYHGFYLIRGNDAN